MLDSFSYKELSAAARAALKDNKTHENLAEATGYIARLSAAHRERDFILFFNEAREETKGEERAVYKKFLKATQPKLHLTLREPDGGSDFDAFAAACNIVINALIEFRVHSFKVVRSGIKMSDVPKQRGKIFTIYCYDNPEKSPEDWSSIMDNLTERLVRAGISPGYKPVSSDNKKELTIPNSNFFKLRFDGNRVTQTEVRPETDSVSQATLILSKRRGEEKIDNQWQGLRVTSSVEQLPNQAWRGAVLSSPTPTPSSGAQLVADDVVSSAGKGTAKTTSPFAANFFTPSSDSSSGVAGSEHEASVDGPAPEAMEMQASESDQSSNEDSYCCSSCCC